MIPLPDSVRTTGSVADDVAGMVGDIGRSPVIVTDAVLLAARVGAIRGALGCDVIVVPGGEPVLATVGALARDIAECGADVVVAVGGGSVLDTAKLGARLVTDPDGLVTRLRAAEPFPGGAAVVAFPTTAGSGAEVTRTAIVSHEGRKTWAWDERLRPDLAVLANELTATTPRPVALSAGLDAFCHAVEAATGQRATAEMRDLGFEAAAVVHGRLTASFDAGNVGARTDMMRAATAAGIAIDSCGTGIGHAVGHALASIVTIPHGLAVMLGLRAGLEWTLDTASDAYDGLGSALGAAPASAALSAVFDEFLDRAGFWAELSRWSPPTPEALVREMRSEDHQPMRRNNARPIEEGDVETVAYAVLEAWRA